MTADEIQPDAPPPADARPLAGIRVLDLSRLLPGPYCSLLLADLGADVVKVETPLAGDYARLAPPELGFGGLFAAVNRDKRSVALNYRHPRGREIVLRLAATADVFLESSLPGQLERRGLGYEAVRAASPRIVYCSLSGFGQAGPYRERAAHDVNYLALTGVLAALAPAGTLPAPPPLQLADLAGGTLGALRILAALVGRERTGAGSYVDVALVDAVVGWLAPIAGGPGTAVPTALAGTLPCYNVYAAADGLALAVGALEPNFWTAFCTTVGRPDLVARQFDGRAVPEVAALIASRPREKWLAAFADVEACVSPVNTLAEAMADAHLRARELVIGEGAATRIGSPIHHPAPSAGMPSPPAYGDLASASPASPAPSSPPTSSPAPELGADTHAILGEVGLSSDEIADLEAAGIAASPSAVGAAGRAARLASLVARISDRGGPPT